jgi:hypothetical protein
MSRACLASYGTSFRNQANGGKIAAVPEAQGFCRRVGYVLPNCRLPVHVLVLPDPGNPVINSIVVINVQFIGNPKPDQ